MSVEKREEEEEAVECAQEYKALSHTHMRSPLTERQEQERSKHECQ